MIEPCSINFPQFTFISSLRGRIKLMIFYSGQVKNAANAEFKVNVVSQFYDGKIYISTMVNCFFVPSDS